MKPLKQDKKAAKRIMPPEHVLNVEKTRDQWEEDVFRNAAYFTVYRRFGRPSNQQRNDERKVFTNFPDAALNAYHDPKALVYAVTDSERFVCIVRSRWRHYLDLWKQINGVVETPS